MRALLLALVLPLAAGCGTGDAPSDVAPAAPPAATVPDSDAPASEAAVDDTPRPALTNLDLQANHASGSVLRVSGVRFASDHIAVDLAFTNGSRHEQKLNTYSHNRFVLRDDLGNVYNLSPPPNNGDVSVPAGQSLEGEFVFLGRLNPGASALTLVTNEQHGGDQSTTRSPKMTVQIPFAS